MSDLTLREVRGYLKAADATMQLRSDGTLLLFGGGEEIPHSIETLTETIRGSSIAPAAPENDNYDSLAEVLGRALSQASVGKGHERHAQDLPFEQQPMQRLIQLFGVGFALGQAGKKAQESMRLPRDRAVHELLGAINYLAGAVIALEAQPLAVHANDNQATTGGRDHG